MQNQAGMTYLFNESSELDNETVEEIEWSKEKIDYWGMMLKRVEEQTKMERNVLRDICKEIDPKNYKINNNRITMAENNGSSIVILSLTGKKVKYDFGEITLLKIERSYPSEVNKEMVYELIHEIINKKIHN